MYQRPTNIHTKEVNNNTIEEKDKLLIDFSNINKSYFNEDYKTLCKRLLNSGNEYMKKEYSQCIDMEGLSASSQELIYY